MYTSHALAADDSASLERSADDNPTPRRGAELPDDAHIRALAESLECVLDADLCALARVKPSTTEAWRKRGIGPPYVLLGNRYLYPREALRKHLSRMLRERIVPARSLL
jgi:hypothetical protein